MQEQEALILEKAQSLFFTYGLKNTTMDRLANELGISKKTLYEHFPSKEILLARVLEDFMTQTRQKLQDLRQKHHAHPLLTHLAWANFIYHTLKEINPVLFHEVARMPQILYQIQKLLEEILTQEALPNIQAGIQQGLFRAEMKLDFLSAFLQRNIAQLFFSPHKFPGELADAYVQMVLFILHGMVTPQGYETLKQYEGYVRRLCPGL
ncbi:MAG: TetR/AcrR family transcriptional regulator [Bacteroidia bacterium]